MFPFVAVSSTGVPPRPRRPRIRRGVCSPSGSIVRSVTSTRPLVADASRLAFASAGSVDLDLAVGGPDLDEIGANAGDVHVDVAVGRSELGATGQSPFTVRPPLVLVATTRPLKPLTSTVPLVDRSRTMADLRRAHVVVERGRHVDQDAVDARRSAARRDRAARPRESRPSAADPWPRPRSGAVTVRTTRTSTLSPSPRGHRDRTVPVGDLHFAAGRQRVAARPLVRRRGGGAAGSPVAGGQASVDGNETAACTAPRRLRERRGAEAMAAMIAAQLS